MSNSLDRIQTPLELARSLIRISSVSGTQGQQDVLDHCERILKSAGFEIQLDSNLKRRYLVAQFGDNSQPKILFACHVDTVPIGLETEWTIDPIAADVSNGMIYGRGSSDMKGGIAAALCAAVESSKKGLASAVLLTTDEEIGCLGAAASLESVKNLNIHAVVIPESTENQISLAHRGAFWIRVRTQGKSAHGSTPELGESALLAMAATLVDLEKKMPRNVDQLLGKTSVNFGTISAGTAVNIVAAQAEATLDIRFSKLEEPSLIANWLKSTYPNLGVETELLLPKLATEVSNSWIQSLSVTASIRKPVGYFTDGSLLQQILQDIPIVIWGPGNPNLVHAPDESISILSLEMATDYYIETIKNWSSLDLS